MASGFESRDEIIARLEELGFDQVSRMWPAGMFHGAWNMVVLEWMAEQNAQREAIQRQIAISSRRAAWIAAWAAVIAAVLAGVGIWVTFSH